MTKAFEKLQADSFFKGRVEEALYRINTFDYKHSIFEIAQYQIRVKDSGRVLGYTVVVTFLNNDAVPQEQFELPATNYAQATQWLIAKEMAFDKAL